VDRFAPFERSRPRARDLDEERSREGGLGRQRLEVGAHSRPGAGQEVIALDGDGAYGADQQLDPGLVSGKETRLLVAEVLVKGASRHPGSPDDIGHGGRRVAPVGDHFSHRFEHAAPLRSEHHLSIQAVGAPRELAGRLVLCDRRHSRVHECL